MLMDNANINLPILILYIRMYIIWSIYLYSTSRWFCRFFEYHTRSKFDSTDRRNIHIIILYTYSIPRLTKAYFFVITYRPAVAYYTI